MLSNSACSGSLEKHHSDGSIDAFGWQAVESTRIQVPTALPISGKTDSRLAQTYIVNIWSSSCPPCREELPLLESVFQDSGVQIVGLSRDRTAETARATLNKYGVSYPNWLDRDAEFAVALDGRVPINAVPTSVLVRNGRVISVHVGPFLSARDVRSVL